MWDLIALLPETVKKWRQSSDLLFRWLATPAALLVVASSVAAVPPTEVAARALAFVGWHSAATWLRTSAPPILSGTGPVARNVFLCAAALLILWMGFALACRILDDEPTWSVGLELQSVAGSRSPVTVWLLLLIAAQQTPLPPTIERSPWMGLSMIWVAGVILMIVHAVRRVRRWGLVDSHQHIGAALAVIAFPLTIVFAAVAPVLAVIGWLCTIQSDAAREAEARLTDRASSRQQSTGAIVMPRTR